MASCRSLGALVHAELLGLLLPLGLGGEALAQAPPETPKAGRPSDISELSLEDLLNLEVVTPSAQAQTVSEAPSTVYVFTKETIRRRGYTYLAQLLEDVPEIEMHFKARPEYSEQIIVRGILGQGNEKIIILLDGFRIDALSKTPHSVGHNFSLVNVERVEVVLGPVSALYGPDAFAGVIQIITRSGAQVQGGRVTGSIGRFNTTEDSFVVGAKAGDLSLAVSGSYYHSDEPTLPNFYPEDFRWYNERYKTRGEVHVSPFAPEDLVVVVPIEPYATPTNDYFLSARLDIGDFRFGYTRHYDRHSSSLPESSDLALFIKDAKWAYTIQSAYGQYTYRSGDEKLELITSLSLNTYEVDPDSAFINYVTSYQRGFKYEQFLVGELEERISYHFLSWLSGTWGLSYRDLAGVPKTADLAKRLDPDASPPEFQGHVYIGTDVRDVTGRDLSVPVDFYNIHEQNLGTYLELRAQPRPWLNVTAGARFDHQTRYGDSLTPRIGVILQPREGTRLKLLYGEGFLAPSPNVAYQHFGSFAPVTDEAGNIIGLKSFFFHLPNPDLKPERLRMGEIIVSQDFGDAVRVSANGYLSHVRNRFGVQLLENQTFKGWPVDVVEQPINLGERFLSYGGTLRLDVLVRSGRLSLNPYASYTFTSGKRGEDPIPSAAMHVVKGGLDIAWRGLSLSTRLIARSSAFHPVLRDENGHLMVIPGSTVVNAHLRYSDIVRFHGISPSLWLDVRNLFDARYYLVSGAVAHLPGVPQDPLRILVGAEVAF
ncbi:TonB-dependent siderophore receptor [Vitiosangium sp. GDMCC 1.1324]|uniref:TonB-dependent receptor plug domain-containing protein n=1 Tax=Vitiosangium sp. (strain GDMCC 1.1324) TaxID=2138576 RepID=UPI000D3AC3BD|nr:TonB-dependent receptor [Vitiosangium sp. GDMCC 1.1324]PTL81831.1 hypothetical protein DAT35_23145 [Vitiosangium sp. GDMCC 1.1324]